MSSYSRSKTRRHMCTNPYCLGPYWCLEWHCCGRMEPEPEPEPKRKKLDHFAKPTSPTSMSKIPPNTGKGTKWALKVFEQWRDNRNRSSQGQCPENLLVEPSIQQLNYWLSRFVVEVRREDGKPYPASSISNILAGLYCHSNAIMHDFMNLKHPSFHNLTGAL